MTETKGEHVTKRLHLSTSTDELKQLREALSDVEAELESTIEYNKILLHGNQTLARQLANVRARVKELEGEMSEMAEIAEM